MSDTLTERQLRILELVAEGHSNATIGRKLDPPAAEDSVKQAIVRIRGKLGNPTTRAHLVSVAYQRGLLDCRTGIMTTALSGATEDAAWERTKHPVLHRHAYVTVDGVTEHGYLSNWCVHGLHRDCVSMVFFGGDRQPPQCAYCHDLCHCWCHTNCGLGHAMTISCQEVADHRRNAENPPTPGVTQV